MYSGSNKIKKSRIDKNGRVGFIFSTYDGASFLWEDFFNLMNRFWPGFDTFFDGYISMCETKQIVASQKLIIQPIGLSNEQTTYSERLAACINHLNCEFIYIVLDDYFLKSCVDLKRFRETIELIKSNNSISCITYENFRSKVTNDEFDLPYMKRLRKTMFICNLQIGLWRTSALQKILRLYESPWQFEYYGSIRACLYNIVSLTIKKGEPAIFDYDFGWLLQRGRFDKKTYDLYVEKGLINSEIGNQIGFYVSKPPKTHSIIFRIKHGCYAVLSMIRR